MLIRRSLTMASLFVLAFALPAFAIPAPAAVTLEIWKAGLTLEMQIPGPAPGTIAKRVLKTNDVINLTLGRPLTTKIDKKTEILALAGDASTPGPESQVVVFNPTARTITATLWTFSNFVLLNNPDFSLNYVVTDVTFVATTLGVPAQDGFLASTIAIAGSGKHANGALGATSTAISGPVSFHAGGTLVSGIILKGKFKTSGGFLAAIS
jgi:hypothetical protein